MKMVLRVHVYTKWAVKNRLVHLHRLIRVISVGILQSSVVSDHEMDSFCPRLDYMKALNMPHGLKDISAKVAFVGTACLDQIVHVCSLHLY